jgi:plasmid stabilization system protein ParE
MSLPLVINPLAEEDLEEAKVWYEEQRDGLGDVLVDCVHQALEQVQQFPGASPIVFLDLRRKLVRRFPYGIYYRVDDDQITVVAVYHGKRDPRGWQERA